MDLLYTPPLLCSTGGPQFTMYRFTIFWFYDGHVLLPLLPFVLIYNIIFILQYLKLSPHGWCTMDAGWSVLHKQTLPAATLLVKSCSRIVHQLLTVSSIHYLYYSISMSINNVDRLCIVCESCTYVQ